MRLSQFYLNSQVICGGDLMILIKLKVKGHITTQMRRVKSYYFSVTDYIPSTTLRGAILNEYYHQKGKIDENFYVSPAYPLKTAPAHYFSPATQRKGAEFREEKGILRKKDEEFLRGKSVEEILKLKGKGHKPKIGALITFSREENGENVYKGKGGESVILMHVAIDKTSGAAREGMLFAYEYKYFEELWALASESSEVIDVVKRIRIGRSKNRVGNYVYIEKVKEVSLEEPKGLSYCLSPCVPSLFEKEFFKAKLIIGDTSIYSGWFTNDKFSGQKPVFTTLKEGSLVYVEGVSENNKKIMAAGLNFMFKIDDLKSLLDRVSP